MSRRASQRRVTRGASGVGVAAGIATIITANMLARFSAANALVSGSDVNSWPSVGGSVASAPAETLTNRPTLVTVSGRPFVRFNPASSQRLVETASALAAALAGTNAYTLYCVVNRTNPGPGVNGTLCGWAQAAGTNLALHACNANLDQYSRFTGGAPTTNLTGGSVWPSTLVTYASVFTGAAVTNYLNAAQIQSAANAVNIGATTIFAIGAYVLSSGSFGGYLPGDIGDLVVYSGAHTLGQVAQNTLALRRLWGA